MKFRNLNDYLYLYTELHFLTRFIQSKIGQDHLAPLKYTKRSLSRKDYHLFNCFYFDSGQRKRRAN